MSQVEYIDLVLIFFTALILTVTITPLFLYLAHKKQLYDIPDKQNTSNSRRVHLFPTPRIGGIAIVISFFLTLFFWQTPHFFSIYLCSLSLFLLGLWDDLKNLGARFRLCFQAVAAFFVVMVSDLSLKYIVISPTFTIQLPFVLGVLISIFIIIGAINSMNMVDGLDGLASGATLIGMSILSYYVFVYETKHAILFAFTMPILGTLVGFLKFNTHPSKIFMGDSGSNWLGFLMGVLMLKTANSHYMIPFLSILLTFAVPIFDTAHVILMRILHGQNPMKADSRHLHHSLIKIGFSHSQSVGILYFFMFFFGFFGMLPIALPQHNLFWVPWLALGILIFLFGFVTPYRFILLKKISNIEAFNQKKLKVTKPIKTIAICIESFQRYAIYGLLFTSPFLFFTNPSLYGLFCAVVCFSMGVYYFIYKICSFITASLIVIAVQLLFAHGKVYNIEVHIFNYNFNLLLIYNIIFLYIFLATICSFTIALKRKFFVISPTDILFVLIPLLILMIPNTWEHVYGLRMIITQSIVLFTALRLHPYMIQNAAQVSSISAKASNKRSESIPNPNLTPNP